MVARKKDKSSASKVASDAKKIEFRVAAPKFPSSQPIVSIGASADELLAHTELRSKAAFLEAQVNASRDGILVIDQNNKRVLSNRRFTELLNIPPHIQADADDTALLKYVSSLTRYPEQFSGKVIYLNNHPAETSQDEIEFKNGMVLDRYSAPVLGKSGECYGRIWMFHDITERKQTEAYQEMGRAVLEILNEPGDFQHSIECVLDALKTRTGFDGVGIRLKNGDDFPYIAQEGFPDDFLLTENSLSERNATGGVCLDNDGNVCLECTCGLVIAGKCDPASPCFTRGGSFWTNDSLQLQDIPPGEDPRYHPRNQCIHHGYSSVALIPVRYKNTIVGLIQFNDRRKGCFSRNTVEILEGIGAYIGAALERKQIEEKLRVEQERLKLAVTSTGMGLYDWNPKTGSVWFSELWATMLGYCVEDLSDYEWSELVHPDDLSVAMKASLDAFCNNTPYICEYRMRHRDGSWRWILDQGRIVSIDAKGKAIRLIGSNLDISGHKLAEAELRVREERLEQLAEQSRTIAWEVNLQGLYTYISRAAEPVLGYMPAEIIGKLHFYDLHPESGRDGFKLAAFAVFEQKESFHDLINHVQAKDGRQLWVATNGIPLLNGDGTLRGYRGSDTDITERQMAEAELIKAKGHAEESDRLKTAFLNNISHEIRTPLNGILGFLSLLEDDTLSAGKKSEYAGMINQSADRLMNIISDTIEMSKIQTGQVKINLVETDINRLSRDLFEQFKQQAETKGLNFTLKNSLSSAYYSIKTDDDKLNSVLGILINNAIKFTQTGSVELEITRNETFLEFSVKDTGPGIPENKRQRIFECFMQADVSNTRKFEGAGLGLAIAQAHVKMLGSDIRFESQEGQGSTFYVTLPYQLTEPGKVCDPQPETPEVVMHAQQFLKILVAEDDEINFDYVNAILTKANYVVLHAWTGVEAVELCRKHADIDIILMDIKMPVMDGYIATSEIRKFNLAIPIIAITAYAAAGDRQNSMDAGMNDYVSKPIKQQALLAVLDKWFPLEYPDVKQEI